MLKTLSENIGLIQIVSSLIGGLIGGVIVNILSPYVQWKLKAEDGKREAKKLLLEKARLYVDKEDFQRSYFVNTDLFARIKPFLSPALVSDIERTKVTITEDGSYYINISSKSIPEREYGLRILNELAKLERKRGYL